MPRAKDKEATLDMLDGWPQVAPELWDKEGALKRGISEGDIRNVKKRGATVETPNGEKIIVPAPVQTQIVVYLEQGEIETDPYNLKIHGELMDIPLMQTTPAELEEQLFADGGDRMVTGGQQLSNKRKEGVSRKNWPAGYQPPVQPR